MIPESIQVTDYDGQILRKGGINERIEEFKKIVLDDEKLKNVRSDDNYLLRFLYCCNFNIEEAFKRMQDFHKLVEDYPDWFICCSPSERKNQIQTRAKAILQCKDKNGRSVYLFRLGNVDTDLSNPKLEIQLDEIWFESVLNDFDTSANGICCLLDITGYSWRLFRWLTPTNIKLIVKTIQYFPCKEFVFHIINTSFLLRASINLVWPFLPEEIKKRIKIHSDNWSSIHEYIDPQVLPPEYGGSAPELNYEKLEQWFLDQDTRIRKCLEYRQRDLDRLSI